MHRMTILGEFQPPACMNECDNVPNPVNYQTNGSKAELWESNTDASNGFCAHQLGWTRMGGAIYLSHHGNGGRVVSGAA